MLIFLTQFAVAENINFLYDNNGNLLEGVNQKYDYNALNQLVKVSDKNGKALEEYTYDSDGDRIKKIEYLSNGKTESTYYPSKNLMRVVNSSGTYDTFYIYDEQGTLLARKDPDGKMFYYHPDHLGSTTLITNEAGAVVEETSYLPFGEVWEGGSDEYLFTGKEKDATGLMYYGARYYDSFLKRFTQPDTVIQEIYNPQNLNRYSYVLNNPYKYTDPDGHNPLLVGLFIGAVIAAAADMIYQILFDDASMFDGSMDWGEVGESALIGGAAGLAGGIAGGGVAALGGGTIVSGISGGLSYGVTGQIFSNVANNQPITNNVISAGVGGAVMGGVFGALGKIFSSASTQSINLNSGKTQMFPLKNLYGTHSLDKSSIMTPEKIKEGLNKGPSEIYNYEGNLIIPDGMGRGGRFALTTGKNSVPGKIMNPDPNDIDGWEIAKYFWENHKKYNMYFLVEKMRKQ